MLSGFDEMNRKILGFIKIFARFFVFLIPKSSKIWVFGSWYGEKYSDNSKYLFEYVNRNSNLLPIWIAKDKRIVREIRSLGFRCYSASSIIGVIYQLRAGYSFVTQDIESDLNVYCYSWNSKVVQLWHGIPLKKIGLDACKVNRKPWSLAYYSIVSSGRRCSESFKTAFGSDRVVELGLARNDSLYLEISHKTEYTKKVLYMPTLRGNKGDMFSLLSLEDLNKLHHSLPDNVEFYLRIHPANVLPGEISSYIHNSDKLFISEEDDVYKNINDYDILVTDLSSIYFDYLLTNRPILHYVPDFDDYIKNERELYYNFDDVALLSIDNDISKLIKSISTVKMEGEYLEQYNRVRDMFHSYVDGNSCKRIFEYYYNE